METLGIKGAMDATTPIWMSLILDGGIFKKLTWLMLLNVVSEVCV